MNREETKKVLKVLATAYPKYFAGMDTSEKLDQIALYEAMFGTYPVEVVVSALHAYIRVNEYPPSIAGLQKQIDLMLPDEDNAAQLWNQLSEACKRGSVMTEEEFQELPEPLKKWCGNVSQIRELSQTEKSVFNSVTRGQFLKTIPQITERLKVSKQLPEHVKTMLGSVGLLEGREG